MSDIMLYRKWRSRSFGDVIGQAVVVRTLQNAIATGRIAHAYLFCGPRGTGKTSVARLLAKAINCEHSEQGEPCNKCILCLQHNEGSSLDVIEIDAASHTGVDDVREFIINRVGFAPTQSRYKVYIIDEVHKLSNAAFNALLKTLEEPPSYVVFVLATTHPQELLPTILSRCQRFDFKRIGHADVLRRLRQVAEAESIDTEEAVLPLLAREAGGSLRDALVLLEQVASYGGSRLTLDHCVDVLGITQDTVLMDFVKLAAERKTLPLLQLIQAVEDEGKDLVQLAKDLIEQYRRLLMVKVTKDPALIEGGADLYKRLSDQAALHETSEIMRALKILMDLRQDLRDDALGKLLWELAVVRLTRLCDDPTLDALQQRMAVLERGSRQGGGDVPAAPPASGAAAPVPDSPVQTAKPGRARGAVASSAPAPPPSDVQALWVKVLARVKQEKMSLYALLVESVPVEIGAKELTIAFRQGYRFHKEKVEAQRRAVEQVLSELAGVKLSLRCVMQDQDTAAPPLLPLGKAAEAPDESHHAFVKEAMELFEGQIT